MATGLVAGVGILEAMREVGTIVAAQRLPVTVAPGLFRHQLAGDTVATCLAELVGSDHARRAARS